MVNFEAGKWYKANIYNENWYIKYKETISNTIKVSMYINGSEFVNKEGNFGSPGTYNFKLLTDLTEIIKYLPQGHPDIKINQIHELW